MLNIYIGEMEGQIVSIDTYFNMNCSDDWSEDPTVQAIIKDIDNFDYVFKNMFKHDVWGYKRLEDISGGSKCLIMFLMRPDLVMRGSNMGDNCFKWIERIASVRDITLSMNYFMRIDPENISSNVLCMNTGKLLKTMDDVFDSYIYNK